MAAGKQPLDDICAGRQVLGARQSTQCGGQRGRLRPRGEPDLRL